MNLIRKISRNKDDVNILFRHNKLSIYTEEETIIAKNINYNQTTNNNNPAYSHIGNLEKETHNLSILLGVIGVMLIIFIMFGANNRCSSNKVAPSYAADSVAAE